MRQYDIRVQCLDPVIVKEEFTSADNPGSMTWNIKRAANTVLKGQRRYLSVTLEPAVIWVGPQVSLAGPKAR